MRAPLPSSGDLEGNFLHDIPPLASGQQAAVLCQGRGLFHPIPDPGSIVEPMIEI